LDKIYTVNATGEELKELTGAVQSAGKNIYHSVI